MHRALLQTVLASLALFYFSGNAQAQTYVYLTATNFGGGGTINDIYPFGRYFSNSTAAVYAAPNSGWTFLEWLGDTAGTSIPTSFVMDRNKSIGAVFATQVNGSVNSNGTLMFNPPGGLHAYGSRLTVTPIPQPGYFFSSWSGSVSGTADPLEMLVTTPTPTITPSFLPLPAGRSTLSVPAVGHGYVTLSPYGGIYYTNDTVTVSAIPDTGYSFLNWSGDASGTNNPLMVSMNQSKVIYANFSDNSNSLVIYPVTAPGTIDGVAVDLLGPQGVHYRLDGSTDLLNWTSLYNLTDYVGTIHYIDLKATNLSRRYYRAAILP